MAIIGKKTNIIFSQILVVGLGLITLFFWFGFSLYQKFFLLGQSVMYKLREICGCNNPFSFTNHPYFSLFLTILSVGMFAFLIYGLVRVSQVRKSTSRFIKAKFVNKKNALSEKLAAAVESAGLTAKVIEVDDENLSVFCYGLLHPKICVSSGVVEKLNKAELEAVLRHEKHHLVVFEPMKLFIIQVISKILFFIPGINFLKKQFMISSEIEADAWATDNFQNKIPLAGALYKIIKWQEGARVKSLSVSFFAAATEERIQKLVESNYVPRVKTIVPKFLASVFILIFSLIYLGGLLSSGKMLQASGGDACLLMKDKGVGQCLAARESSCEMSHNYVNHSCSEARQCV